MSAICSDRAHAVKPVRPDVARQIEKLVGGEIGRRHAMQDLLIGRIRRFRRAPVLSDQRLDRRPVDHVQRIERAACAGEARIDRRRVDDQEVLDQDIQPVAERKGGAGRGELPAPSASKMEGYVC